MPRVGELVYLKQQLDGEKHDFYSQYRGLSDEDKATLRLWAGQEMDALGMEK